MNTNTVVVRLPALEAHALWAETYDLNPNPLLALEERIVRPILPNMQGMTVLDVACGTGRWLAKLLDYRPRAAMGLDLSPAMLQQARCKPLLQERLIQADCMKIPVGSAAVDFAISSFAVSYVSHLHHFASELSRVMRNGGYLLLTDFHPSAHLRGWKRSFRHHGNIVEIASHERSVGCICDAFEARGFELTSRMDVHFGNQKGIFSNNVEGNTSSRNYAGTQRSSFAI